MVEEMGMAKYTFVWPYIECSNMVSWENMETQ